MVGKIYKYECGDYSLYTRALAVDADERYDLMALQAPQGYLRHTWKLDEINTMTLSGWEPANSDCCIICNKRNPCRLLEVTCFGCREAKWLK